MFFMVLVNINNPAISSNTAMKRGKLCKENSWQHKWVFHEVGRYVFSLDSPKPTEKCGEVGGIIRMWRLVAVVFLSSTAVYRKQKALLRTENILKWKGIIQKCLSRENLMNIYTRGHEVKSKNLTLLI